MGLFEQMISSLFFQLSTFYLLRVVSTCLLEGVWSHCTNTPVLEPGMSALGSESRTVPAQVCLKLP